MRRVVVTGLGIVSPLGVGCQTAWANLVAAKSGLVALSEDRFGKLPSRVAGVVPRGPYAEGKWDAAEWVDRTSMRRVPLFAQYAVAAARQALDDAQWAPETEAQQCATGVAVGSGIGGFDALYENVVNYETGGYRKVSPLFVPSLLNNMAAGHISIMNGLKGPNHSASTACTTGAHDIGDAFNFIRLGMADVMVAGSTEAPIHPLAVSGFARAKSLSTNYNDDPEQASRPFDKDRSGFVIGEGAAVMVLESLDHAVARKRNIYAEVVGYGLSGDAHHITAPRDDGDGAFRSMQAALKSAGVEPHQVGYINAHATSTRLGDAAESNAIARLFGSAAAVSSTKGATGHLLGGAGSLEAVFTVLALHHGVLPPTLNLQALEPEFPDLNYVPLKPQSTQIDYALTNSFGFGGTNASLIFKRHS
ncbi:3-oxoacyl-[acyl-carrier-protein] synthase homolog [Trichomonascus vanleenenianus]|uniref:fatty acid synthase CEM1 n=1 Tax=Trichomonascus vanleenenianus TaxID=2268995 RepID=UPI003ECB5962